MPSGSNRWTPIFNFVPHIVVWGSCFFCCTSCFLPSCFLPSSFLPSFLLRPPPPLHTQNPPTQTSHTQSHNMSHTSSPTPHTTRPHNISHTISQHVTHTISHTTNRISHTTQHHKTIQPLTRNFTYHTVIHSTAAVCGPCCLPRGRMYALASCGRRRSAGSICVLCAALAACQGVGCTPWRRPGVVWAPPLCQ